jgi:hypothetical protein
VVSQKNKPHGQGHVVRSNWGGGGSGNNRLETPAWRLYNDIMLKLTLVAPPIPLPPLPQIADKVPTVLPLLNNLTNEACYQKRHLS